MSVRTSFSLARRWLACGLLVLSGLGGTGAQAASQADWWVYVANDNADDIGQLLAQGADPNVRHKNGQPAIMRAVVEGAWHVFDRLAADPRTDLNIENPAQETPLMYLAVAGQTDRARQLIARGAQVNRLGWTPLHYAASKGHVATARLLLDHQAMVNAPAPDGTTPLMMAAFSGNRDMVQLLLRAGADPATRNLKGQNAADWAQAGKAGRLSQELAALIAGVETERQALRDKADASAPAPQDAVSAPAAAPVLAKPAQEPDGGGVSGVSGVRTDENNLPSGN